MISEDELKREVNNLLFIYYPVKTEFNKINNLSHFFINSSNWNKFLQYSFDINGVILNGTYKNYIIKNVITKTNNYLWKDFLFCAVSYLNNMFNPCISENKFLILLYTYNNIDILHIKKLIIEKNNSIIDLNILYTKNPTYSILWDNYNLSNKINQDNHFYFNSFNVHSNKENLKTELDRLFIYRDTYKSIHFHLDNNGGGDIVPAHLIIRCLVGKKEIWMKNIKKYLTSKAILEWDCWKEESIDSPNYETIKDLNLDFIPNYDTKYTGKIYLYMDKNNGSSAWFFITYLIYAFSDNIIRFNKKCFGKNLKFGNINSNKLILVGHSGTTSGDGNAINIKYKSIKLNIPTEQFISCSIKKIDWNRYWFA